MWRVSDRKCIPLRLPWGSGRRMVVKRESDKLKPIPRKQNKKGWVGGKIFLEGCACPANDLILVPDSPIYYLSLFSNNWEPMFDKLKMSRYYEFVLADPRTADAHASLSSKLASSSHRVRVAGSIRFLGTWEPSWFSLRYLTLYVGHESLGSHAINLREASVICKKSPIHINDIKHDTRRRTTTVLITFAVRLR